MKRSLDDTTGPPKRMRGPMFGAGGVEIRFLIPSKVAGAVIGKGGDNIKQLRQQFHADVSIPDSNTPERVVVVSASENDCVLSIANNVVQKIEENYTMGNDPELKLLVHASQAGAIIGKAGVRIKELRQNTDVTLKVYGECCPRSTDRVVLIGGNGEKILNCLREILKILEETPPRGISRPYDTSCYESHFIEEYGGYGGIPDPPRPGVSGRGGLRGRGARGGGMGMGASRPHYEADHYQMYPPTTGYDEYYDCGAVVVPVPGYENDGEPPQTLQVTIPTELAGCILGKGGDRLNRIRAETGAKITLHEAEPGSHERIITILASKSRVHAAQRALQDCVKASAAGRRYIYEANR